MNRLLCLLLICIIGQIRLSAQGILDTLGNTIVRIETAVDSAQFAGGYASGPWDLHMGPDGQLWFTDQTAIRRWHPVTGVISTVLRVPSGYFMGLAHHSDFLHQPYVYATIDTGYYYGQSTRIEVWRYRYNSAVDSLEDPLFLLSWYHPGEHSGGRMVFGQDSCLYIGTADYAGLQWQDTLFMNSGKVLRVRPDGSVPSDNPRPDYSWTWGHRNPQGIVQVPNGNIIVSEYGQINDELNLIRRGNHYGWIIFDGNQCIGSIDTCNAYQSSLTFPIDVGQNPPSGITWYDHPSIPELRGLVQAVTGINQGLIAYTMNATMDSIVNKQYFLRYEYGRVRDACAGPDGSLYFIAYDRSSPRIMRVRNALNTGVSNTETKETVLFPNPASEYLQYQTALPATMTTCIIRDLQERLVLHRNLQGDQGILNVGHLKSGTYSFQIGSSHPVLLVIL